MAFGYKKILLMSEIEVNLENGLCCHKSEGVSSFSPGKVV